MVRFKKKSLCQRIRLVWSKWTRWGKALVIFSIPFALAGLSFASVLALPAIITLHYVTMIIKNIMDIYQGWIWGNPFAYKPQQENQVISENELDSDDSFVKFPTVDPRISKKSKVSAKIKSFFKEDFQSQSPENIGQKNEEVQASKVEKAKEEISEAPAKAEKEKEATDNVSNKKAEENNKDAKIASAKQQKLVDTSKTEKKKSKA